MTTLTPTSETIGGELKSLLGTRWKSPEICHWAPDLFAVCAGLLQVTGGYTRVLAAWPPAANLADWKREIGRNAAKLRLNCEAKLRGRSVRTPPEVVKRWETIVSSEHVDLQDVAEYPDLGSALLELVAIADQACVGFGLPTIGAAETDSVELNLLLEIQLLLQDCGTLTPRFARTRLVTLPKQHTPKYGITLRSLTHHLALFTGGEVDPSWSIQPEPHGSQLNLLVVPWPFHVHASQFAKAQCPDIVFAEGFECFDYSVAPTRQVLDESGVDLDFEAWLRALFDRAVVLCGEVNGVIFPEASLEPTDFETLNRVALEFRAFVVAGVTSKPIVDPVTDRCGTSGSNEVWMTFGEDDSRLDRKITQAKHHRWQLDQGQVEMYGLGGCLEPSIRWWENIDIRSREVSFVAIHGLLTICCLICEDLARQDPVARLVRAVGPNLVIALLADGPQLAARWPARYATVLADDPGSSVLTVTSLGMTQLADPPPGKSKSRAIALWKDAFGGLKEISLEPGAMGVVLNLWSRQGKEVSADGRDDEGVAAYPSLAGVHQVSLRRG